MNFDKSVQIPTGQIRSKHLTYYSFWH